MIETLLALLVFFVVGGLLLAVARLVLSAFPLPQPFANLAYAVVLLLVLFLCLSEVGWIGHPHAWRSWH